MIKFIYCGIINTVIIVINIVFIFFSVAGDGAEEQPFVQEKASGYETNLYLYSVSLRSLIISKNVL